MLTAIVSIVARTPTLGGVREALADFDKFGLPDTIELLDGGHTTVDGDPDNPIASSYIETMTVGMLRSWVTQYADLPDSTPAVGADSICVDLPVLGVEPIMCGDHIGESKNDVLVTVHDCVLS